MFCRSCVLVVVSGLDGETTSTLNSNLNLNLYSIITCIYFSEMSEMKGMQEMI